MLPIPLGSDPEGRSYVIDPGLKEIHRFDEDGKASGTIVGPGQGPGEMRNRPWTFGLQREGLWYSELADGRVHFVSYDGESRQVRDSGWDYLRLGARMAEVVPAEGWLSDRFILRAESVGPYDLTSTPSVTVSFHRTDSERIDTILRYSTPSLDVKLDGGRTSVRIPAPQSGPFVLYRPESDDFVRMHRGAGGDTSSEVIVQVLSASGEVVKEQSLIASARELTTEDRAWMRERLLWNASFDGRRDLSAAVSRELEALIDRVPATLPPFDGMAAGPESSVWLRSTVAPSEEVIEGEWLVLDAQLRPTAYARLPARSSNLQFLPGRAWWVTMDEHGQVPYVARLGFVEEDAGPS